jgi:hypothetical protein
LDGAGIELEAVDVVVGAVGATNGGDEFVSLDVLFKTD